MICVWNDLLELHLCLASLIHSFFFNQLFYEFGLTFGKVTAWYLMKDLCEFGEAIKGWLSCNALYNCFQEYVDDGKIIEGQQVLGFFSILFFFYL